MHQAKEVLHSKGNYKQSQNTAYLMEDGIFQMIYLRRDEYTKYTKKTSYN